MKYVQMVVTSDGVIHKDLNRAAHHAEERYAAEVTKLAHEIVRVEKYTEAVTFVESVIDRFARLRELRNDCRIETKEEDAFND